MTDKKACSFCNKAQDEVPILLAGRQLVICDLCVDQYSAAVYQESGEGNGSPIVLCSFCGRQKDKLRKVFSRKDAGVCSECLILCEELVRNQKQLMNLFSKGHRDSAIILEFETHVPETIAEVQVLFEWPDGKRVTARIWLGKPFPNNSGAWTWRCPVGIDGIEDEVPMGPGTSSFQALSRSYRVLKVFVADFLAEGGKVFLVDEDGNPAEAFDFDRHFY